MEQGQPCCDLCDGPLDRPVIRFSHLSIRETEDYALETAIVCRITWHCWSDVRKAISEASRPLPMRTIPSIGASLVGSISHQSFSM